jgi:aspartate aminotransferase
LITKNKEVRDAVMKFCQARLSPPLIGQIAAEASLDAPEEYSRETYDEYVERRKCLIDGLNRIPGVYSPIPMGASIRWPSCRLMTPISFVLGVFLI